MVGAAPRRGFAIFGFPRSGTTLLSRLLDAHPQVSSPPETYLAGLRRASCPSRRRLRVRPSGCSRRLPSWGSRPRR
ncbi:MAG: sulfotransferase [Sphingomonadaceae bacterium]